MKKKSPYTIFLKHVIYNLEENGLLDLYKQRHLKTNLDCKPHIKQENPLGFSKLSSLFLMLFLGVILSFFISIYEYYKQPKVVTNSLSQEKMEYQNSIRNLINLLEELYEKV